MTQEEKVLDRVLVFMKDKISEKGMQLNQVMFNFKPSETLHSFNAPNEIIPDGVNLIELKKTINSKDHDFIVGALNRAITEGFIRDRSCQKYTMMLLNELGLARAKSVEANEHMKWRKRLDYFSDKILVPLAVAIAVTLITNYLSQKDTNAEINSLRKEIEWIKQQQ